MKKIPVVPFIVLLVFVCIFFRPFLLQARLPVPADTIVGLYDPFRDLYAKNYPNGIPFKNFLVTDPVRQQYPWRSLAIDLEKKGQLPLWNPYSLAGTPLLANFQTGALYPLNIFLFILPFSIGWSVLVFLQPLLASVFLYLYLLKMRLSKNASLFGALIFSSCGFTISWLEWNTLAQVILWLPLILLAKEHLLKKISVRWLAVLFLAEYSSFLAGHLQVLFYTLLISNTYLFARIIQISQKNHKKQSIVVYAARKYAPFLVFGMILFVVTAIAWLPTLQFILQSGRDVDQLNNWQKDGWFIPWQHLIQFFAPDFFGNPTTLNYFGVWNYAELVGYIGILPLIFALFAMFFRRDKKTWYFSGLVVLSLLFALPTFLAKIPFILRIPFLSTAQPTRLLSITDFSLSILAALGVDLYFRSSKKHHLLYPVFFVGLVFVGLWMYVLFGHNFFGGFSPSQVFISKHNLYFPTIIFGVATLVCLIPLLIKHKKLPFVLMSLLIIISVFDLLRFSEKFTPFTIRSYLFPKTAALSYLQSQPGQFRIMTTDPQIFPPNFSVMYHLQSLDGYDPLYLRRFGEFIAAMERGKPDITAPFGFNRIITPHNYDSRLVDLLGVSYVLSLTDLHSSKLQRVYAEGQTRVYRNLDAFTRTFFVKFVIPTQTKQETINRLFDPKVNLRNTAIIEDSSLEKNIFSQGRAFVSKYTENAIEIDTKNSDTGFLVFMDTYYPTWHAKICSLDNSNCNETKIYLTNYTFRGVVVPAGEHKIIFFNMLLY